MGQVERAPEIDILTVYMEDVGNAHPRVCRQEEQRLAQLIARGRDAKETLKHTPNLSEEERTHLLETVDDAKCAFTAMIEANLPLVVGIAKKYAHHRGSLPDLIQVGNIGLMRAVESYDAQRGTRFGTHATWNVWSHITHAVSRNGYPQTVSLDRGLDVQNEGTLLDVISDPGEENPSDQTDLRMSLWSVIQAAGLSKRELQILRLRFIDDQTLQATASALKIRSRQSIHQQEIRVLEKLRAVAERQGLREHL